MVFFIYSWVMNGYEKHYINTFLILINLYVFCSSGVSKSLRFKKIFSVQRNKDLEECHCANCYFLAANAYKTSEMSNIYTSSNAHYGMIQTQKTGHCHNDSVYFRTFGHIRMHYELLPQFISCSTNWITKYRNRNTQFIKYC